jgi:hypothetical protein
MKSLVEGPTVSDAVENSFVDHGLKAIGKVTKAVLAHPASRKVLPRRPSRDEAETRRACDGDKVWIQFQNDGFSVEDIDRALRPLCLKGRGEE